VRRLDDAVTFLLRELRLMAAAYEADPNCEGTVTLNAADAHAILAVFDRTAGKTRRRRGGEAGRGQPAALVRARRVQVLRRELRLEPGQKLDADVLKAARDVLTRHGLAQKNDTRLRAEIDAARPRLRAEIGEATK
jgi:hypothetical protein